jgi:signal transduction histidine kinase
MFVLVQAVSDMIPADFPVFYVLAILMLLAYLLSRSYHLNAATFTVVISFSGLPYVTLARTGSWTPSNELLFMIWIPIAMLTGSYLLDTRQTTFLVIAHSIAFSIVVWTHPHVLPLAAQGFREALLSLFGLALLVHTGTWAREYYVNILEKTNEDLYRTKRQLEIYASLIRHDIGNDLLILGGRTKLALEALHPDQDEARENLQASLASSMRMSGLLRGFSRTHGGEVMGFMIMLERIAALAEEVSPGLKILVEAGPERQEFKVRSELLPLVFDNLFRNAAMYAGESPTVKVSVKKVGLDVLVEVSDDGRGMPPEIKENLFKKGTTTGQGSGMGLYLTRRIVEHLRGAIVLVDEDKKPGCTFLITLPIESLE